VSVRQALGSSLNVPAVRTLVMVSPDAFFAQLRRLGLALRESGGYYGYSLALGSGEVRLLELTNAYRALANGGRVSPVAYAPGARAAFTQALDAGAAFIVGDILADANARVPTFGSDSVLNTRFWSAVKTGTSKDMRDNWAMGWSQRYTVGVWVGNAGGSPMHDVSGSSGAAPIWADVMAWLHRAAPSHAPRPPAGVLRQPVRFDGGADRLESPREEWFVRGTQQAVFAIDMEAPDAYIASASGKKNMNFGTPARIIAPAPGSIIALDPDIPPAHQRLQLQAQGGTALRWRIDGRPVGQGAALAWLPWPGRHRVELLDAQGQMQDSVQIEVRGAGVKPGPGRPGGAGGAMP